MRLSVLTLTAIAIGCGSGGSNEGRPLNAAETALYEQVENCMGLYASPPEVFLDSTVACPTSGRMRCMASVPFYQINGVWYGNAGEYNWRTNTIELPDQDLGGMAHEMIHAVLHGNKLDMDYDHKGPYWHCESFRLAPEAI